MKKYHIEILLVAGLLAGGCRHGYRKNRSHGEASDEAIARGEVLARTYCGSCHELPTPDMLDANSWEQGVLPQMGPRLGIFQYRNKRYPNNIGDPNVGRKAYPDSALLSAQDWGAILDYYTALAPDSMGKQQRDVAIVADTTRFRVEDAGPIGVSPTTATGPPATCFVGYDARLGGVLTSDILRHTLDIWDKGLSHEKSLLMGGAVVDVIPDSAGYFVCNIGPFGPNNAPAGHVDRMGLSMAVAGSGRPLPIVADSLVRPVALARGDLNGDGLPDLVVSEFGFIRGELAWLENKGGGRYAKRVLRDVPGAIRTVIEDYNGDGLPDIWALFAQGDETIIVYINKGHGVFEERRVLRWPPCYGSSYFELDDLNKDGFPDILFTCGDNGDYSQVLKPYHGVYIYMNDGHGRFSQGYFFPINGCYRAMARDFDGDGDLDIACIAYFADFRGQPDEGFVYLENEGSGAAGPSGMGAGRFRAYSVPGTARGRWITMDVADADGDGRTDILLANCSVGPGFIKGAVDWKKGPPFVLLHNRMGGVR